MMEITNPIRQVGDETIEKTLRPQKLEDFVNQERIKEILKISIESAKKRGASLDHILLYGPPGLGKTTLAHIIAKEMGKKIIATSGPALEKKVDLVGILTKLEDGDILFIDEIHRLSKPLEEYLYPAMEDFKVDVIIEPGPNARTIKLNLNKFTLIGATTRTGLLSSPFKSRFEFEFRLTYYQPEHLKKIILRSAKILGIDIDEEAAFEIAKRSRGTPRIANRLLKRARDMALYMSEKKITKKVAKEMLDKLGIDENGLCELDRKILETIVKKYAGGPVGLKTISASVGEDPGTIEADFEPYLLQEGYIQRTQRGRKATQKAFNLFR